MTVAKRGDKTCHFLTWIFGALGACKQKTLKRGTPPCFPHVPEDSSLCVLPFRECAPYRNPAAGTGIKHSSTQLLGEMSREGGAA